VVLSKYNNEEEANTHFKTIPNYQTGVVMTKGKVLQIACNTSQCWSSCAGHILVESIENIYTEELHKGHNPSYYSLTTTLKLA